VKAIVLRAFGGPEVLRLEDVPRPSPAAGEVLVEVRAVSVNRTLDLRVRRGDYSKRVNLPHVLGADPSGPIVEIGPGVQRAIGERVTVSSHIRCGRCEHCLRGEESGCTVSESIGVHRWGGYAEYLAVPERNAFSIPDGLSFAEATVVGRHLPAAFNLARTSHLRSGEWVLVMGAAGALGSAGVQVARRLGATVIAAAGSDERVAWAVSLGAQAGVNYRTHDLTGEVRRLTGGHGVDVVFENISDPVLWPKAFASLAPHGRLVTMGSHGGGMVTLDVTRLYLSRLRVIGAAGADRRDIERALREAAGGTFRPHIDRVLPLARAAEAHRLLEEGAPLGKVILDPTATS
jgi:NADPH:quinone reductase-like Zn-dependent oxidoreductase